MESIAVSSEVAESSVEGVESVEEDGGMLCDSVKRKRVKKMNRHKHKKRLKKERHSTRKSHT